VCGPSEDDISGREREDGHRVRATVRAEAGARRPGWRPGRSGRAGGGWGVATAGAQVMATWI
jgi:hypothetical protein